MYKGSRSRFLPFIIVVIVIVLVVAAFVGLGRLIFGGGDSSQPSGDKAPLSSELLNAGNSRAVSMTVRGPIVGNEEFRSYQITVSSDERSITSWKGYDRTNVIDSKRLDNDEKAYREFIYALDYAGFTKSAEVESDNTNGLCSKGRVYDFQLLAGSSVVDHRWTTNCGVKGSFRGDGPAIRELFLKQIPNASEIVNKVDL